MKLLLSVEEALEATGIGRSKFYELVAAGEIESVEVGRRRLVPVEALQEFVERLRAESRRYRDERPPKRAPDSSTTTTPDQEAAGGHRT